jgi:hypothetical protein
MAPALSTGRVVCARLGSAGLPRVSYWTITLLQPPTTSTLEST